MARQRDRVRLPKVNLSRVRIPKIRFAGTEESSQRSPVATYYLIVVPALVLTGFGLLMGFSAQAVTSIANGANPYTAYMRPVVIIIGSLIAAALAQMVPEKKWRQVAIPVFIFAVIFQSLVLSPLGYSEGGNANWVRIPGTDILMQPSELLKLALILMLARTLARPGSRNSDLKQMAVTAGGPIILALIAVMLGHDLGTAMVVAVAAFGALWVARLPGKWFLTLILVMIPVLTFLVFSNKTRLRRVAAILPWNQAERDLSAPEQIDHSLWALGSGGLTGLGPGASREKWNYLQAAHTDFIFAIIGEEFGLMGTLTVLVSIGLLVWGMVRVCQDSPSQFASIVTGGIAAWIGFQAIINVMSVTGMGPVIGVPLPLVSYGGSSFLFTATAIGVVASFARSHAGMRMIGAPDEASAGRDPRITPRRRPVR
ncbi:FtsW/RodA/SpoVE family cell cycle protein [Schaalia sp. ZJ405]|uniref:FtsW/RodA/SpoVE family cell cycle protein n=1 Tax=unclassified Schaalia TaxID=2691889 RepID=UPI0013EC8B2D|nr:MULTISPECIES: FtsW/RodA/SpoVE family cell cycle protein [unclassified Schaalia]QPK81868.1 FtsW/RodA/SpoVE family cell cycle protein [Schaalia sp. ZJ405]